jgi:SAM-dependent methyltransferase
MDSDRVDYDGIASTYDRRYQANELRGVGSALARVVQEMGAQRVLEVGCGTGRWLTELSGLAHQVVGLDFSEGMLREALSRRATLPLARGAASPLPFVDGVLDLVFCVNALPHFDRQRAFIAESYRVLRPGGTLVIVGRDPHGTREDLYIYRYFPGTYERDLERFPTWETVADWMAREGLRRVEWHPVEHISDPKVGRQVLSNPFLQKNQTSQLALLSDEAYASGLRRIEDAVEEAEARGETVVFPMSVTLCMLTGQKRETGS